MALDRRQAEQIGHDGEKVGVDKWIVGPLEDTKRFLELLTERIPPGEGQRHGIMLEGDKLAVTLMLGEICQPVMVEGDGLIIPVVVLVERICRLMNAELEVDAPDEGI
jgi:hypothetical protein